jgi:muramoyltetrapeptide carboxypeptidase
MEVVKPKKLKPGDTIGIIAPSSWMDPVYLNKCVGILEGKGFKVFVHPQCLLPTQGASAGSVSDKISALHDVFLNSEIDAVFCTQGGQEAVHLLDKIDYEIIRNNPKIFAGFSDTTALLNAFASKSGLVNFHGPHLAYFGFEDSKGTTDIMLRFLSGDWQGNLFDHGKNIEILQQGDATGNLVGGNYPLFAGLLLSQNNYVPALEGSILVIEAIGKEVSQIDQSLGAMRIAGIFEKVSGVIFGHFTDIKDTPNSLGRDFNIALKDVLYRNTKDVKGPVIFNVPIGHEHPNITWPLGIKARLTVTQNAAELFLKESPFSDA